jgi:hypothetical protein
MFLFDKAVRKLTGKTVEDLAQIDLIGVVKGHLGEAIVNKSFKLILLTRSLQPFHDQSHSFFQRFIY